MLDSLQSSAESQPYVAIISPLEPSPAQRAGERVPGIEPEGQEHPMSDEAEPWDRVAAGWTLGPSAARPLVAAMGKEAPGARPLVAAMCKEAAAAPPRQRRAWAPDDDDHLIYQWVKFDGKSQVQVACCFGISQSTVSRIVQRYERWQAHAAEREEGRLDPAERRRVQRWLAFERNEKMLLACLRLADKVEEGHEVSKSVTSRPLAHPSREETLRTESSVLDRTGMAARFLRLAFRINMEQLKLTDAEPPRPGPPPARAAALMDRLEALRKMAGQEAGAGGREAGVGGQEAGVGGREPVVADVGSVKESGNDTCDPCTLTPAFSQREREMLAACASVHNLHNLHNENVSKSGVSHDAAEACAAVAANHEFGESRLFDSEPCGEGGRGQPPRSSA